MSYEMFEDILRWGKQEKIIGLLGGEPTLHPDIIKMVLLAKKQASVGLFTNLLCRREIIEEYINIGNVGLLVNSTYRESLKDLFFTNTEFLYKNKNKLLSNNVVYSYGITLMNDEVQDEKNINKILDIVKLFPDFIKSIRIGLAVPYDNREFKLLSYNKVFKDFKNKLFNLTEDVNIYFDCPTNNCQISPRLMGECMENKKILDFRLNCSDCIFEVLADGKIVYCFACPKDFLTIESYKKFNSSEAVRRWYNVHVRDYLKKYRYQCKNLSDNKYCSNSVCNGVCLAINEYLRRQNLPQI
jgi:MoaA/NifB/PqqE/SkfB family radical SAM enzyme